MITESRFARLCRRTWAPGALLLFLCAAPACSTTAPKPDPSTRSQAQALWPTSTLRTARTDYAATELGDGRVLVCGGTYDDTEFNTHYVTTCEVYSPADRAWSDTAWPALPEGRALFTLTLLEPGKVLVAGGINESGSIASARVGTQSGWSLEEAIVSRYHHTASLLPNGKVLLVGGASRVAPGNTDVVNRAQLRDTNGVWHDAGLQKVAYHAATLLPSGSVLVTGGVVDVDSTPSQKAVLFSEPAQWVALPDMPEPRWDHTATLLDDGEVLVVGGIGQSDVLDTARRFSATSKSWSEPSKITARTGHAAARLDKLVIIAGGRSPESQEGVTLSSVQAYDPNADGAEAWSELVPLKVPRVGFSLVPSNGSLLAPAGNDGQTFHNTVDAISLACQNGTECPSTWYCDASSHSCRPRQSRGASCGAASECQGGLFCTDKVCCESECQGQCQHCDAGGKCVLQQGPTPKDRPACSTQGFDAGCGPSCADDPNACTFPSNASCGEASCAADKRTETQVGRCDGSGHCAQPKQACDEFSCTNGHCLSACGKNQDCAVGYYCQAAACVVRPGPGRPCAEDKPCTEGLSCVDEVCCTVRSCEAGSTCASPSAAGYCRKVNGTACTDNDECASEHCVGDQDKVCCESECSGSEQSCAQAGKEGQCLSTLAPPECVRDGDCAQGLTCKDGACVPAECSAPDQCGRGKTCDSGLCVPVECSSSDDCGAKNACKDQLCVPAECLSAESCAKGNVCINRLCAPPECSSAAECSGGKACKDGLCITAECSSDGECLEAKVCTDGLCVPAECSSPDDCGAGSLCQQGRCVLKKTAPSTGCDSGCPADEECRDGQCQPKAASCLNTGCPAGWACQADSAQAGAARCVKLVATASCASSQDCPSGYACQQDPKDSTRRICVEDPKEPSSNPNDGCSFRPRPSQHQASNAGWLLLLSIGAFARARRTRRA